MTRYLFVVLFCLSGCTSEQVMSTLGTELTVTSRFGVNAGAPLNGEFKVEKGDGWNEYSYEFVERTQNLWGEDLVSSPDLFVKYTNGYKSRVKIDFTAKQIEVSTISGVAPKKFLERAISTILLAPLSPEKVDIYTSKDIEIGGKPFLYERVLDQNGKPIRWQWSARNYAKYLIDQKMTINTVMYRKAHSVVFPFDQFQSEEIGNFQYANLVSAASKKYGIGQDLIYAIIKTESSFNPFAVSPVGAYGLMQVVPRTAGADVNRLLRGKSGKPTRKQLFDPAFNIDMGTAYLSILKDRYLKGINDPVSQEYAMISAYNGGSGGVFRAFGTRSPKKAMQRINSMTPDRVYKTLREKHRYEEARNYLHRVTANKKKFNQSSS